MQIKANSTFHSTQSSPNSNVPEKEPAVMSDTIIVSLGSPSLLSFSNAPPQRVNLPLTPATALQKSLLTHLQSQPVQQIVVAEPPLSFPKTARECLKHVARRRNAQLTFYHPFRCIRAIIPCTFVIDVTRPCCVVYDACHVDVAESVEDVISCVHKFVARYDRFTNAELRAVVVGHRGDFVREIRKCWDATPDVPGLTFVKCVFDNSVLVWVGAAVLARCGVEDEGDGDAIG